MPTALQPLLLDSIALRLPRSHQSMLRRNPAADRLRPVIEYRNIFQTDKVDPSEYSKIWEDKNRGDGWVLDFYSDARAQEWVDETFHDGERGVKWAYHAMRRGVLKADFLRYLLPMIKGGVYSDTDVGWLNCQANLRHGLNVGYRNGARLSLRRTTSRARTACLGEKLSRQSQQ